MDRNGNANRLLSPLVVSKSAHYFLIQSKQNQWVVLSLCFFSKSRRCVCFSNNVLIFLIDLIEASKRFAQNDDEWTKNGTLARNTGLWFLLVVVDWKLRVHG